MGNRYRSTTSPRRVQAECALFAARLRAGRAVLSWSQTELGKNAGLTQRAIYRLEKAAVRPRQLTQIRIDRAFKNAGVEFVELPDGGFEMIAPGRALTRTSPKTPG